MVILSWTNSTVAVVDISGTIAGATPTSVQAPLVFGRDSSGALKWVILASGNFYIAGNVGIETTEPGDKLVVSKTVGANTGQVRFGGENGRTLSAYNNGNLANFDFHANETYFNSNFLIPSDKKIKTAHGSIGNLYLSTDDVSKAIYTDRKLTVAGTGDTTIAGNVGIGKTDPGYKLEVAGTAGKPGGGSWTDSSDIRLKTNITELNGALSKVLQLSPKEYYRLDREEKEIGLIADDVLKVFPNWVGERTPTDEEINKSLFIENDKVKTLTFPSEFNAVIVKSIQELKAEKDTEIQELKNEIQELKELICLDHPDAEICGK